ncbi:MULTISPECIES: hypothetical protein [Flavobacterium]|jgi:arginyl-tRNA--protein-N-Asp/Glu arginylyltransferase|uniref:Prophage protein DUF1660 n=1 Tax=Flavobacterium lindanitolerans TaxID=428988 RepID=A0A497U936_9FLAO|nr:MULTISPECIES: hypothetical protein [Flavobacterium]PZQ80100.1 MAG: hypothetical protein DI548_14240 [Flavobacterium johnsoniae]KQS47480.1 hypothetical protein ASG38_08530 [Flavobacterium sp. Leaf359]MBC8645152.1 hypothetical protein [Flavobacterium lindanitolerans]MBL7868813.1 hypothetical protein [Flavobacterium lindanitolerans]MDQ7961314.1 hypothetical protein [Flavobacterium lindanitolerans]
MNPNIARHNVLFEKAFCRFFGHKFKTTRKITDHFKEFECKVCHRCATNDILGNKIHLSEEMKDINKALNQLYERRQIAL